MPSCERCWRDAHSGYPYVDVAERYAELIAERRETPCTPEQQAGPDAWNCPKCDRRTIHQWCGVCMACGHDEAARKARRKE